MLVQIAALLILATSAGGQATNRASAPSLFQSLSQQAEAARDAKRLDEALTLYKKALELEASWEEGWWNAGNIAYDLNQYTECAADFSRLAALKPDLAPAWTMEGLCEYQVQDYNAALKSLTQVQRMDFKEELELSRAARLHLALVLTKLGYFEKAIVLLFDQTKIDQKTPEIIVPAGIAGLRRPWIPPEVPQSDRDKVFKLGDAMAAVMEGDKKGAIAKFETVVRAYPKDPDVHYRYGAFLVGEDSDRGIEEIKKTLELEPGHIPALVALVRVFLKRDDPQTALPYAKKAVKLAPGDFNTHVALGRVLLATSDAAGAVRELELGVKLGPDNPEAHYSLGTAYGRMGRKADATRERLESQRLRESRETSQQ